MPVGFSKACRTCLTLDGTLISIYDAISYDGKGRVIDMIKDITKITPIKSDGLPELVCQTCFNEINRCYTFKVKCLNSDSTLRKLFATEEEFAGQPQQVRVEEEEKECKPIIQNLMTLYGSDQVEPEQEPPPIKIKTEKDCNALGYFVITSVCGAEDGQTFENFQAPQRYIKEEIDYDIDYYNTSSTRGLTHSDVCPSNQSLCFDNFSQETNCLQVKLEPEEPLESEPHNINTPLKPNIQCPKCGREFLYTSRLKKHMRSHDTRPYVCSVCCRTFKLSAQLRRHIDINHKHIKPFKCEECPRTFSFPSKLKEHQRSHNKGNKYPRNINSLSRTSVDKKEKEDQPIPIVKQRKSIDYTGQNQYEQKQEPKYDANTKDISSNLEDTFEDKSSIWMNDHQRLTRLSARNRREEMKSPDFATNQIQANSTTIESACIKVKTRQSEKSTHIDYSFDSQDQNPEENNSPEGARKYNCPHCTKVFKYVSRLNEHVVCHSDARPFDCTNCGKFFKTPGQLTRHLKTSHKISSLSRRKAFSRRRGFKRRNVNMGLVRKNVDPSSNQVNELNITENENKDEQTIETSNNLQNEQSIEKENTNEQTEETSNDFPENDAKHPVVNKNENNQAGSPSAIMSDQIGNEEVNAQSNKVVSECSNQLVESAVVETINETEKEITNEPPRIYHCDQCDKTFQSVSRYYQHMQGHGIDRPFICSLCGKGFKTYSNLNSHIIISHKKLKPFKCNDCQRTFSCKSNLKKHLSTRIWTNSCIEGFTGRQSTKKKVKDKKNLPDVNVDQLENKDSIINDHKDKQNDDEQVEEINKNLENVETSVHETDAVGLHQEETNIPADSESVEVSPDIPDPQELPHPLFDSMLNQAENTSVEQTSKNPLECPVCKKIFVYLSYLKKHLQSHSSERPFGCSICDKNFKYKVSLKHHMAITHAKYKPYKCDKCPQEFVNEYNYRVHRNSHNKKTKKTKAKHRLAITNSDDAELLKNTAEDKSANNMEERNVVETNIEHTTCSVCSSSVQTVKLTEHMQQYHNTPESTSAVTDPTNQGETLITDSTNPLKCPQCGKVFLFASYLKKHMRCHNDERPHVCSNCGKAFKDHWRLRSHIREKHTLASKKYSHKKKKKNHNREKPLSTIIDHEDEQNLNAKEEPCKMLSDSQEHCNEKDNLHENKCSESILEKSDPSKSKIETMSKQEEKPSVSTAKPQCSLCNRVFLFASQLETHMRTHTGERPFSCPSCEKTFTQRGHLKNHILINHKKIMPFQCSYCLRGFASGFNMRVHMKTHTKEKRKKGNTNQKSNSVPGQADEHGTVGTTQETVANPQDSIQEQVIQDFEKLELHPLFGTMSNQDETTNNEPSNYFECTNCDKTFLFRSQFNEHMQTHNTDPRPITCSICYKTFKMEAHLKNHTQMKHTKTKNYKCNECDRVFLTFYILNKHMKAHKGNCKSKAKSKLGLQKRLNNLKQNQRPKQLYDNSVNEDQIEVGNIKTTSTSLEQVQKEIPAGRNDAQITCALCSVSVFSEDLTNHMKLCLSSSKLKSEPLEDPQILGHPLFETLSNQDEQQTGDSKHCLQCKKDFCNASRLAEHMRTHTDERPFICTACGRGFKQSGHLKSHFMIVHQKILPYKCNECPRVFSSRYNLKVHETTHTTKSNRKKGSSKRRVVVKKSYYKDPPYHAKPIPAGNANQPTVRENKRNENETGNKNENKNENENESDKINDMFQNPKEHNIESEFAFGGRNEEKIRCSLCFVSVHPNNLTKHMQELHNLPEATLVKVKTEPSDKTEYPEESEQLMHLSFENVLNHTESAQSNSPRRLQCPTCDKEFVHLSRLNEHLRTHSDERPFICLVCGKTFKRHGHLMTHIATCHKKSKPFKCKECPRTFSSSFNLNVHLQTHISKELPTVLPVETSLQNEDNVESLPNDVPQYSIDDEITGESTGDVMHQCTLCPTVFKSISHLMEHMKVHTSDQPFICSLCGKGFNSDDDLSAHLLLKHNKLKPFHCDQCKRKFRTSTGLKKHLFIHTVDYRQQMREAMRRERINKKHNHDPNNQEPFSYSEVVPQCHICKKEFTNNWVLKEHMRCHTNEKPFVCPICGNGFNKKYNLKIHIMAHKKIKPFKCAYCPQSFCTNSGRNHHLRTHTHGRNRIKEVASLTPGNLTL